MPSESRNPEEIFNHVCPVCGGDGEFEVLEGFDPRTGDPLGYYDPCDFCGGKGEVETDPAGEEMFDE